MEDGRMDVDMTLVEGVATAAAAAVGEALSRAPAGDGVGYAIAAATWYRAVPLAAREIVDLLYRHGCPEAAAQVTFDSNGQKKAKAAKRFQARLADLRVALAG